jgi:hypothetical protein
MLGGALRINIRNDLSSQPNAYTAYLFCDAELDQADKDQWEQFVSGKLAEINKRNNTDLVSKPTERN